MVGVFLLGYWMRHFLLAGVLEDLLGIPNDFRLGLSHYIVSGTVMGIIELFMLRTFGVYRREFGVARIEELAWILRSSWMAVIITFAFTFASRQLSFSRFVLVLAFPATSIFIYLWHKLFHFLSKRRALRSGKGIRIAFYGTDDATRMLADYMRTKMSVPFEIGGFLHMAAGVSADEPQNTFSFGSEEEMFSWVDEAGVTELIISDPGLSRKETASLIQACERENIGYKLVADISDLATRTTRVLHLGGTTMIESVPPPLSGSSIVFKRIFDLLLALPLLLLFLPLGIVISIAIIIDSGFPLFYVQSRFGREQREFRMIKFRSMKAGSDSQRPDETEGDLLSKSSQDPRITRVGRLIRKLSLDELPQLLNVLAGSMSLVGPRPHIPREVRRYHLRHMKKLQVLPGMTGLCQVSGRNDLSYGEMVKLDLYYVDNWSIWMDLSILTLTIPAIIFRRGAY